MTPAAERCFDSCPDPEAERRRQAELLPCKRIGEPSEVAYTALFLASDEACFITLPTCWSMAGAASSITLDQVAGASRSIHYRDARGEDRRSRRASSASSDTPEFSGPLHRVNVKPAAQIAP